jgi:hypothetical protein
MGSLDTFPSTSSLTSSAQTQRPPSPARAPLSPSSTSCADAEEGGVQDEVGDEKPCDGDIDDRWRTPLYGQVSRARHSSGRLHPACVRGGRCMSYPLCFLFFLSLACFSPPLSFPHRPPDSSQERGGYVRGSAARLEARGDEREVTVAEQPDVVAAGGSTQLETLEGRSPEPMEVDELSPQQGASIGAASNQWQAAAASASGRHRAPDHDDSAADAREDFSVLGARRWW